MPSVVPPPYRPAAAVRRRAPAARPLVVLVAALAALAGAAGCGDREPPPPLPDTAVAADTVADADCTLGPAQITGRGIGRVRLGMDDDALRAACGARDTMVTLGEGLFEPALAVHVDRATAIAVLDVNGTVERVLVPARGPTTAGGVGVGSRLVSVRARHGDLCAMAGEGTIVAMAPALSGVSFVTDADFAVLAGDRDALRDGDLPRATRVTAVWVHGEPATCAP